MANVDSRYGLRPVRHRNGAPYNGACTAYYVPASYGTALFIGDPVVKTGTANTTEVDGYNPGTLPVINKATAGDGNATTGVIVGFKKLTDDDQIYNSANTEAIAFVADDPDLVFHMQASSTGVLAATSVGLNANYIFTHGGDTVTGYSGVELDTTSDVPAADASNQLTILRFVDAANNEIAEHADVEVSINNHTEAHGALGI